MMRKPLLLLSLFLLLAACAAEPSTDPSTEIGTEASVTSDSAWVEPNDYEYTLTASCGLWDLNGEFDLVVEDGAVVSVDPLDEYARDYVALLDDAPPTIGELLDLVDRARSDGAEVVDVDSDAEGQPSRISIDYDTRTVDDERCFAIDDITTAN